VSGPGSGANDKGEPQRLDKWLWYARLAKSRSLAAGLVTNGKIRVNRQRTLKPSHPVKTGDVITSAAQKTVRVVRVKAPGLRRGPPAEARCLYEELTPHPAEPNALGRSPRRAEGESSCGGAQGARPQGAGRPTKRERRLIDHLKGREA
jgi:ribosome-associated heat shock protein Hsp15